MQDKSRSYLPSSNDAEAEYIPPDYGRRLPPVPPSGPGGMHRFFRRRAAIRTWLPPFHPLRIALVVFLLFGFGYFAVNYALLNAAVRANAVELNFRLRDVQEEQLDIARELSEPVPCVTVPPPPVAPRSGR